MIKVEYVLKAVNNVTSVFSLADGNSFALYKHAPKVLRIKIMGNNSLAYNRYPEGGEEVKVVKWFSDFWLFVDIQFLTPKGIMISISVFQGDEFDNKKVQLFRIEWDDYEKGDDSHPQPHWHFLTNKLVEDNAKEFADLLGEEANTLSTFIDETVSRMVDLSKFHFALNADWANSTSHIHPINNEKKLSNWFGGLLGYLKKELQFLERKALY